MRGRVGGGPERERGREARSGVDRRGDMLRYGSGRTVSTTTTTTTTTEDSPESLSEVRSPRDSGHWNYPSVSPLFSPPSFLYFANSPVFFSPTLLCLSLVAFNSVATCFLLVFLNFPSQHFLVHFQFMFVIGCVHLQEHVMGAECAAGRAVMFI